MQKHVREIISRAQAICEPHGIEVKYETGARRYCKLVLTRGSETRRTPVACTPTNADAAINTKLQDVRRIVREMEAAA